MDLGTHTVIFVKEMLPKMDLEISLFFLAQGLKSFWCNSHSHSHHSLTLSEVNAVVVEMVVVLHKFVVKLPKKISFDLLETMKTNESDLNLQKTRLQMSQDHSVPHRMFVELNMGIGEQKLESALVEDPTLDAYLLELCLHKFVGYQNHHESQMV